MRLQGWALAVVILAVSTQWLLPRLGGELPTWPGCGENADVASCDAAVLITGCSSGLGRHAAVTLASQGYTVFATVRRDADTQSLLQEKVAGAGRIVPLLMDVTSDTSVAAAVKTVQASKIALVAVVNNAGVSKGTWMPETTVQDYQTVLDVNVLGVVRTTRAFLPLLPKGGRVVNIGSVAGVIAFKKSGPYGASKFALEAISDGWRQELRSTHDVSVSLVEPGFVASKMCKDDHCDASQLSSVSNAIAHAISAPFPRARYPVAWVVVMPSWCAIWLRRLLPCRVIDLIISVVVDVVGIDL